MKVVVITGSSRGIGYGLADSFLALGCQVVINGRDCQKLEESRLKLATKYNPDQILSVAGDIGDYNSVQLLWEQARSRFGHVDIWINNAGCGHPRYPVWEQSPQRIEQVIHTNLLGSIYGCKVAIAGMLQQGFGAVYLMEGSGSNGSKLPYFALYGTTKYAIRFLTDSLKRETKGTPVIVGAISPGVVVTDLLTGQYDESQQARWQQVKFLINIVADRVETVTPWLSRQILANQKTGVRIAWLTLPKVIWRFGCALFRKRDLFAES